MIDPNKPLIVRQTAVPTRNGRLKINLPLEPSRPQQPESAQEPAAQEVDPVAVGLKAAFGVRSDTTAPVRLRRESPAPVPTSPSSEMLREPGLKEWGIHAAVVGRVDVHNGPVYFPGDFKGGDFTS